MWGERYIYSPSPLQRILAIFLLPISFLWCLAVCIKFLIGKIRPHKPCLPVISVGNLSLGGSGKTPICIAIASCIDGAAVVLRGYKRSSKGLIVVGINGKIFVDVEQSGDEAMLYASLLKNSIVIVSTDRLQGIKKAKDLGARYVLLDDGFSKFNIAKLDILLTPKHKPAMPFCIPSGGYRYPIFMYKCADILLSQDLHYQRHTQISNPSERMFLVSAIANPSRLNGFLNLTIGHKFFPDHYHFSRDELLNIIKSNNASTLLVTRKDAVKMQKFDIELSIIELEITILPQILTRLENFIKYNTL